MYDCLEKVTWCEVVDAVIDGTQFCFKSSPHRFKYRTNTVTKTDLWISD